ncbi:MAG: winged helix DNA-binding protein [Bacteroidaceae bacterium]|nr:winged helix DNA-binding protein [Bacteroidaceae bacterium]
MMDSNIDYRLIFALMSGKVSNALNRRLNENFKKAGIAISAEQWNVLLTLTMREVATQQQICEDTSFSKTTMTRLLNQLEDMRVLERFKSRVDWRSNYLRITKEGLALRDQAQYIASKTLKSSLRGLTQEEIQISQKGLKTALENLNRQSEVAPPEEISELMKFFRLRKKRRLR